MVKKLSDEKIAQLKQDFLLGKTMLQLSKDYNINKDYVYKIISEARLSRKKAGIKVIEGFKDLKTFKL